MRLKRIKHTDLSVDDKFSFLLPIGALEQHGPFIPFGTDTYICDYLVGKIEQEFPELVIIPTLEFSRSEEHKGFYGTIYLTEETLEKVLFDVCNSIYEKAENIFICSFHHNDPYINKFIEKYSDFFQHTKLIFLEIQNDDDDEEISRLLGGPVDDHAGNSEISNMLVIDESTVKMPSAEDKKTYIENPFETDNLAEKSHNGIADNHPEWIVNKQLGQDILDIYTKRMAVNLNKYLN